MAESFDFQINDLKFRAATSDRFPYARATAPFRKEQFDAAATVGDQSLAGWWTRGQLSFHKGAGLKYYEVLEDEAVLNRFDDSVLVDPLDTPGEVGLVNEVGDYTTTTLTTGLTWAAAQRESGLDGVAFIQSEVLYKAPPGGAATSSAMVDASTASVACSVPTESAVFVGTSGKSIERHFADAGTARLYTHSQTFDAIFYEKGRLWAIDALGDLYTLPPNPSAPPVAVAGSDLLVRLARPTIPSWSMTSTPADVYLADGAQTIYRFTLDPDGSVPTVAAPIVAAVLPEGENIRFVRAHLGQIVIGTDAGVRVGFTDSGGGIIYGPLHDTGECARGTAVKGTSVWFVAGEGMSNTNYVTAINLAQNVSDIEFAWAHVWPITGAGSSNMGALVLNRSVGYYRGTDTTGFITGQIKSSAEARGGGLTATGSLTTAYHRMGTLDSKRFVEVLVRADGDGVIEVSQVDSEGGITSLGSMTVVSSDKDSKKAAFRFAYTEPIERTALRFTLTRSTTSAGPTLLGYQIKALPSPVRQRLIKWPLMIQDVVRDRYGVSRGTREGAWTAWSEIEALEEQDALVTFTDHRTGETGEAYIESLELQTDTPSQGASSGFGGVGYVTLRKVG